ncbi:HRDC domain-containing protein [Actinomyces sp.]|uniref:HRDC domain-containing protein n=1 Tax=Actinomyces sp. TaxID=29317 RepID=UPI0026DD3B37|nr:HRDC domain-containing protein [Actinomyces sp.]MDO4901855.1 HRDC domain-containing protein [Actinomyces sp.]
MPVDAVIDYRCPAEGLPPVTDTPAALIRAAAALDAGTGPIAVDAERASGFRYGQDAYLVQLRRQNAGTVLIDPRQAGELSALADVLDGPEWVLHAADQDLPCLTALGLTAKTLFDTELAARLLGRQHVGLGAVVEETLGLRLAKDHAAADWSTRPLPESWLVYAALDVELLLPLRDALKEELEAAGRMQWAAQEFAHELAHPSRPPRPDPWRRTPRSGPALRSPRSAAVLRELWTVREDLARRLDVTPSKLLPHRALVAAAVARPKSRHRLATLREFSSRTARQYHQLWWQAVERALSLPEDQLPPVHAPLAPGELPQPRSWNRHHPEAAGALEQVRGAVRERAEQLRIPHELLLGTDAQRHLAWQIGEGRAAGVEVDVSVAGITAVLEALDARPWQIEQVVPHLRRHLIAAPGQAPSRNRHQ